MKVSTICILSLSFLFLQKIAIAQSTPEIHINGMTLGNTNVMYQSVGNIISPSVSLQPTTVMGAGQVEYKAGVSIGLKDGFSAYGMTGNGYFHAYIEEPDFDVVFIEPNQSYPTVGLYEKLELGLKLPTSINQNIATFLTSATATFLNPYDPDQINVEATFTQGSSNHKRPGFYYKEYERNPNALSSGVDAQWDDVSSEYEWRIRFAPPYNGNWSCNINVYLNGSTTPSYSVTGIQFMVSESGKSGFLQVANDFRHLKTSNGNSFVPIGQNIPWCDKIMFRGFWENYDPNNPWNGITNPNFQNRLYATGYLDMLDFIQNLADNDGNLARVVNWEKSYLYEWEELGIYGSNRNPLVDDNFKRQKMAWELDKVFETAESNDVKLLYCLEYGGQWTYHSSYTENYWNSPYRLTNATDPPDFFSNATQIQNYEKKLRYFMARWGYSSSLGILQFLSEFDGWSYDNADMNDKISDHKSNPFLAGNIYNWHNMVGSYVKNSVTRPILLTSGFSGDALPSDPIGVFYASPNIDLTIYNRYGNDRSENWEMSREAQGYMNNFNQPFLYTETGLAMNSANQQDADPNDTEGCDDVVFHNFLWAGATTGNAGTNLPWWQHFDNNRRVHFKALKTFMSSIDFNANSFTVNRNWPHTPFLYCAKWELNKNTNLESYYVGAKDPNDHNHINRVFGWIHNLSNYWWNLSSYRNCRDRWNIIPQGSICDDDNYNSPVSLSGPYNNIMEIHGLKKWGHYNIEWFSTYGNGGIISTNNDQANIFGIAKFHLPGIAFDYAYKVYRAGSNFHESDPTYLELETDTINCMDDTIYVEDPGDPSSTYWWNFGNDTFSDLPNPTIVFNQPGQYNIMLIVTDSLGNQDTIVQTIVKLPCDSTEEKSIHINDNQQSPNSIVNPTIEDEMFNKYVRIIPNPNSGEFMIYISSPISINTNVHLRDLFGRTLYSGAISILKGANQIPIFKSELSSGIYFIIVEGFDEPIKMIITK